MGCSQNKLRLGNIGAGFIVLDVLSSAHLEQRSLIFDALQGAWS
jgi:hypothetical protein